MERQELENYLEILEGFKRLISVIPSEHQRLMLDVDLCNSEMNDILHDIEFSKLDRTTGSRKAKALQKVQRRRRDNKEKIEITAVLNQFAVSNKKLISEVQKVLNLVKNIKKEQENRTYVPRVNTDIEIAFKHYDKETGTIN